MKDIRTYIAGANEAELWDAAVARVIEARKGVVRWANSVRGETPGTFRHSVVSNYGANIFSTKNILQPMINLGVYDQVITEEDRREGIRWVMSMYQGNNRFFDPELFSRRPETWPADEPFPEPMVASLSDFAISILERYGAKDVPRRVPSYTMNEQEYADRSMDIMRGETWETDVWRAGSHAGRVARWLMLWYMEGKIDFHYVLDAVRWFYDTQDPETGFWGSPKLSLQNRINGAFKLIVIVYNVMGIPIHHPEKLIDHALEALYDPAYDDAVGGCDEVDNWEVIRSCRRDARPGYRIEEIRKLALYRIARFIELTQKPDGGFSFYADHCTPAIETPPHQIHISPALPQGDVMGLFGVSTTILLCSIILGDEFKAACGLPIDPPKPLAPEQARFNEALRAALERG